MPTNIYHPNVVEPVFKPSMATEKIYARYHYNPISVVRLAKVSLSARKYASTVSLTRISPWDFNLCGSSFLICLRTLTKDPRFLLI